MVATVGPKLGGTSESERKTFIEPISSLCREVHQREMLEHRQAPNGEEDCRERHNPRESADPPRRSVLGCNFWRHRANRRLAIHLSRQKLRRDRRLLRMVL